MPDASRAQTFAGLRLRAAYDALIASGASATEAAALDYMPCGQWGPSASGQRVFTVVRGAEDRVAAIDLGSEISIFDLSTLRRSEQSN